jgi:hypothetical protein
MAQQNNWSSEQDEIVIDFVRNHEALYNVKSADYRKMQLKQKLWYEVGTILHKTGENYLLFYNYKEVYILCISMFSTLTILPFNSPGSVEIKFKLIANVKRCVSSTCIIFHIN